MLLAIADILDYEVFELVDLSSLIANQGFGFLIMVTKIYSLQSYSVLKFYYENDALGGVTSRLCSVDAKTQAIDGKAIAFLITTEWPL